MKMWLRITVTVFGVLIVLSAVGAVKGLQIQRMAAHGESFAAPPQTVTVSRATRTEWETTLHAVGTVDAVQGVTIRAELPGRVARIAFEPGTRIDAGQLLLQQDISAESAELEAARSQVALTAKQLERAHKLLEDQVVPRATVDELQSSHAQARARVAVIRATIAKKTIKAPFAGRLGVRQVNLGEVLAGGEPIVSLQALDPLYVNFRLPQQEVARLEPGLAVRVSGDALADRFFEGTVTAVNPEIDPRTRNILVQATLPNPDERLRPGMYARVAVVLPVRRTVVTVPATAVHHAPYSDSVFVVEGPGQEDVSTVRVLRQQFVRLGETRGDFVVVREGLDPGQEVVSTGVFKLRNGQAVTIDNRLAPPFDAAPRPTDA